MIKPNLATTALRRARSAARKTLTRTSWGRSRLEARQHRRAIAFYSELIGPGDLCFDVGANVGDRTEIFRAVGASVIAVEPQRSCVAELNRRFDADRSVTIEPVAIGSVTGEAQIAICDEDSTISTMSDRWQNEGRFADRTWARHESVPMTTLDELIGTYGTPRFCKIDVEGFERQVLEGLSEPLPYASFEFTREFLDEARACVEVLSRIAPVAVNCSAGEAMRFVTDWVEPSELFATIRSLPGDWGDIYVRTS